MKNVTRIVVVVVCACAGKSDEKLVLVDPVIYGPAVSQRRIRLRSASARMSRIASGGSDGALQGWSIPSRTMSAFLFLISSRP